MEKEIATLSSIPAWRIPWTEEPGRFPVRGIARVRLDLVTKPSPPPERKKMWCFCCIHDHN